MLVNAALDGRKLTMRRFNLILMFTALVLAINTESAADWNAQYTPTRKEWLELSLSRRIADVTNLWERRVNVGVVVFSKEESIAIVLATPNGEVNLSSTVCANYVSIVRKIANDHIKEYGWAKGAKVEILCA